MMANPNPDPGSERNDDLQLDDFSLDDDELFADLDNELKLDEQEGEGMAGFDDPALPGGDPGSEAGGLEAEGGADDLGIDLDDLGLDESDLDLGDLGSAAEAPASAEGGGAGTDLGDLDLGDIGAGTGTEASDDFGLGDLSGESDGLDLGGGSAGGDDFELDLGDLEGDTGSDALELGAADDVEPGGSADAGTGLESDGGDFDLDLEDAGDADSLSVSAEDLDLDIDLSESAAESASDSADLDLDDMEEGDAFDGEGLDLGDLEAEPGDGDSFGLDDLEVEAGGEETASGVSADDLDFDLSDLEEEGGSIDDSVTDLDLDNLAAEDLDVETDEAAEAVAGGADEVIDLDLDEVPEALPEDINLDVPDADQPSATSDEMEPDALELPEDIDLTPEASGARVELADLAGGETEEGDFHAAPDLDLDALEAEELSFGDWEGGMTAAPSAEEEFFAVPDVDIDEETLAGVGGEGTTTSGGGEKPFFASPDVRLSEDEVLELNLDDLAPVEETQSGGGSARMPARRAIEREWLLSIPRKVNVEIGSVSLTGGELMDLTYGSVVQLDQAVGEPVELVLEGNLIAEGEIVVINGKNLGVRITSVKG